MTFNAKDVSGRCLSCGTITKVNDTNIASVICSLESRIKELETALEDQAVDHCKDLEEAEAEIKKLEAENKRIRDEALEKAANVAERTRAIDVTQGEAVDCCGDEIARTLRALKTPDGKEKSE